MTACMQATIDGALGVMPMLRTTSIKMRLIPPRADGCIQRWRKSDRLRGFFFS